MIGWGGKHPTGRLTFCIPQLSSGHKPRAKSDTSVSDRPALELITGKQDERRIAMKYKTLQYGFANYQSALLKVFLNLARTSEGSLNAPPCCR